MADSRLEGRLRSLQGYGAHAVLFVVISGSVLLLLVSLVTVAQFLPTAAAIVNHAVAPVAMVPLFEKISVYVPPFGVPGVTFHVGVDPWPPTIVMPAGSASVIVIFTGHGIAGPELVMVIL